MATTDQLEAFDTAEFCHLLLIDGIETAFTDNDILLSGDFTGHGHTIVNMLDSTDLELPENLDLRGGKLDEISASFTLVDTADILPALFRAEDTTEEPLAVTIYPGDSLAAMTQVHSKHVGTEAIGSSGERHRFPCILAFQIGDMHIGQDQELLHHRPAPVSDNPIVWKGRRCAFYRVYIDLDGTRRALAESRRLWWGTIDDQGTVNGREWHIEALGPQSWLQKDLGMLTQREAVPALGVTELATDAGQDQSRIGVSFHRVGVYSAAQNEIYGERAFTASITGLTPLDMISDISAELATAVATAGADGTFDAADNRYVSIDAQGVIAIHVDEDNANEAAVVMQLTLHHKVWTRLGYDPVAQYGLEEGVSDWVWFRYYDTDGDGSLPNAGAPHGEAPGAGYISARITSREGADENNGDNNGNPRTYRPLYGGGVSTLFADLNNGNGQLVDLGDGFGSNVVAVRGQLSRPVASDPDDPTAGYPMPAGAANRQGLMLFFGKRRIGNGPEFDEYQVGEVSWRSGSLTQQGIIASAVVVVTKWLEPKLYGYNARKLESDWAFRANAPLELRVQAVPILSLSYNQGNTTEEAHVLIERLLRSTGTSTGWSGFADENPTLDGGDNDSAGVVRRDGEVSDLGLHVPDEMVANILEFGIEGEALPEDLGRVKVAFSPGMSSDVILEGLMRPHGWAWSLRGGVYGIFSPYRTPDPLEIDVVLDWSNKAGSFSAMRESITGQEIRFKAPIDTTEAEYSWAAHTDEYRKETKVDSKDVGRRYRSGGIVDKHPARWMRSDSGWYERSRSTMDWWSKRHFPVLQWPYMGRETRHVGEFVRFSDPRGVNPSGVYGITGMIGVIVGVTHVVRPGKGEPFSRLDIVCYANTATSPRLHGFSARVIGIDTTNNRLYTADNWIGFGDPLWPGDHSFFVEPSFPGLDAVTGDADIAFVQWDGTSWRRPVTGIVATGTGTDATGDYIQLDGAPAEFFHKMDTIAYGAPRDGAQTGQWVLDYYGVICAEDGTFTGGDGFQWED